MSSSSHLQPSSAIRYQTFEPQAQSNDMADKFHSDEPQRRSSVIDKVGAFETVNAKAPIEKGLNPHGDATTFMNGGFDAYYRPGEHWEGIHRYDPDFTWDPAEEKRLVRKVRSAIHSR